MTSGAGGFDLTGRTVLVTGGSGVLGRTIALGLSRNGARVGVLARGRGKLEATAQEIRDLGGDSMSLPADVMIREELEGVRVAMTEAWGGLDILVNAAGGNLDGATLPSQGVLNDLDLAAFRNVLDLNLLGALLPIQVFARLMAGRPSGSIVTMSSMAALRPLSRVAGYGAAKAGLENLTRWLAVQLAGEFGGKIRVNAVAPGFFVSEQNHDLLFGQDGELTERGKAIIVHTPMGRFGDPSDIVGAVTWLASDASRFVTGAVIPVDGGFSAFAGV